MVAGQLGGLAMYWYDGDTPCPNQRKCQSQLLLVSKFSSCIFSWSGGLAMCWYAGDTPCPHAAAVSRPNIHLLFILLSSLFIFMAVTTATRPAPTQPH